MPCIARARRGLHAEDMTDLYSPLNRAATEHLSSTGSHPRCVFVTGGPRAYLHGINCIAKRLQMVQSKIPLVVVTQHEDEVFMQKHVLPDSPRRPQIVSWQRFPHPSNRSKPWRFRSPRVMDKLNLFGMPFKRLVWLDADFFLRRNVDELCDLPEDVRLAAALDDIPYLTPDPVRRRFGDLTAPINCWQDKGHKLSKPTKCKPLCRKNRELSTAPEARPFVGLRAREYPPPHNDCPYVLNTGVMVLSPFGLREFNEKVVRPVVNGEVESYDSGDQGIIASLLYGTNGSFVGSSNYMRLHPRYNVVARASGRAEEAWSRRQTKQSLANIPAILLHFTRETRPWLNSPGNFSAVDQQQFASASDASGTVTNITARTTTHQTARKEWLSSCARGVCGAIGSRDDPVEQGFFTIDKAAIAVSTQWKQFCASKGSMLV